MSRVFNVKKSILCLAILMSACASPSYRYVEQGKQNYTILTAHPNGDVRVTSGGVVKLKADATGEKFRAIGIRMVLSNQSSDEPWVMQTRDQSISFENSNGKIGPVFAKTNDGAVNELSLKKGEMKVIHLFFKLPENITSEKIAEFDFHWQIKAGEEKVERTTSFDRASGDPYLYSAPYDDAYPYNGPYLGAGFYGWGPAPVSVAPMRPMVMPSRPVIVGH